MRQPEWLEFSAHRAVTDPAAECALETQRPITETGQPIPLTGHVDQRREVRIPCRASGSHNLQVAIRARSGSRPCIQVPDRRRTEAVPIEAVALNGTDPPDHFEPVASRR